MSSKVLNLAVGEGNERVALEEVKDTLSEQIHDNADMAPVIKAVPQVYTSISVLCIVRFECRQDAQFNPRGISVFLDGSDDLDGNQLVSPLILGLDDLSKRALA